VTETQEPTALRLLVSRSNKSRRTDDIRVRLGITQVMESGSVGVKCGLLAEGAADLYLHTSPKSSRWDACAPEAVLRAAGGSFTDLWGGTYRYDGTELQNVRGILGCNAAAFSRVLPTVQEVMGPVPPGP
jgi:3'(2'), 5'-bisphosphate nucleotidase